MIKQVANQPCLKSAAFNDALVFWVKMHLVVKLTLRNFAAQFALEKSLLVSRGFLSLHFFFYSATGICYLSFEFFTLILKLKHIAHRFSVVLSGIGPFVEEVVWNLRTVKLKRIQKCFPLFHQFSPELLQIEFVPVSEVHINSLIVVTQRIAGRNRALQFYFPSCKETMSFGENLSGTAFCCNFVFLAVFKHFVSKIAEIKLDLAQQRVT